jgi:sucrose-6F-phosphate phosphohydrolase
VRLIKLFCSDLDGTLLGNQEAIERFNKTWSRLRERPLLCYNSGRLVDNMLRAIQDELLPQPDFLIGGVGTQIYDCRENRPVAEFEKHLQMGWNLARVEKIVESFPGITRQPAEYLLPHKSSWFLDNAVVADVIRRRLEQAGLAATVVHSHGYDLDVLPAGGGKGHALKWLCERLDIPLKQVVVAGDAGNDSNMFLLPEVCRIVVGNALPELRESVAHLETFNATRRFADGVLEGLAHFKVVPGAAVTPD